MTQQKKSILPWFIVGGMSLFVLFILQFLVRSMGEDINLVGDNYYDKAQQYDQQMETVRQTREEGKGLGIIFHDSSNIVELVIPEALQAATGNIKFYRPSDYKMDFTMEVAKGHRKYNVANIEKGLWQIQLTLHDGDKAYFKERQVIIK